MQDNYPPGVDGSEPEIMGEIEMKRPRVYRKIDLTHLSFVRCENDDKSISDGIDYDTWLDACGIHARSSSQTHKWYNDGWTPQDVRDRIQDYAS